MVRNAGIVNGKQTISIKWYTPELVYPEGVNIYRKEPNGAWLKMNAKPVKRQDSIRAEEYKKDEDLYFFIPLMKEAKKEDLKGLLLLQVLVKSWESEVFSQFLGIQYNDTTVQAGRTYTYRVSRVKDNTEELIAESSPVNSGPEFLDEPVKEIVIKTDTNKVKIKWKPEEQRFFGVMVYRSEDNRSWKSVRKNPTVVSKYRDTLGRLRYPEVFFVDDSLKEGFYYYQLAGVDFFGKETKRSESFKVEIKDLIPPPAPEALRDSIDNLNVFLKWTNPKSSDISGINIYRSTRSDGPFAKINPELLPISTVAYKDQVEKPGPYYYLVSSVDKSGNEGRSLPTFAEVHDIVPPAKPMGLSANADTGYIKLSWQKNNEADLKGYLIYRTSNKNDKNNFVLMNTHPIKDNTFTDKLPVSAKNKFLYKVIAVDTSYNKSDASEVVTAQMPDIIPPVKPLIKNIRNVERFIVVEWIPNKDADLMGYDIYRGTTDNNYSKLNKDLISPSVLKYVDQTVSPGTNYYYYLVAVDSASNESQPSSVQKGYNNFNVTKGVEDLSIKYRKDKKDIQITWELEASQGLLGVVVYRKQKESDPMVPLSGQVKENEFFDKNIKEGDTYYYEIRAFDKSGTIIKSEIKKISIKN